MSSDVAITTTDLSKAYRIVHRQARPTTLAEALVGQLQNPRRRGQTELFWALKDVNVTVRRGEAVGIIGRNGAGKSTFLKILSRITEPTAGEARLWGRVGSLLEVGTGFHPELTGRENIYLNGAILGMRRSDIFRRFDEIVAFAEVDQFLDTPVKRYSSGMYVRLAFAVAAHLDTEILLVDEVLAVGDAAFQLKCLSRMRTAGQEGRTILFVSHNLGAVTSLCRLAILVDGGKVAAAGAAQDVVERYVASASSPTADVAFATEARPETRVVFRRCWVEDAGHGCRDLFGVAEGLTLGLALDCRARVEGLEVSFRLSNSVGQPVLTSSLSNSRGTLTDWAPGEKHFRIKIPGGLLAPDLYSVTVSAHRPNIEMIDHHDHVLRFRVQETGSVFHGYVGHSGATYGNILTSFDWEGGPVRECHS